MLKTQVMATSSMVEGNMGKFESQNSSLYTGEEFLFERMCTFEV
jgi:hypothetical protein